MSSRKPDDNDKRRGLELAALRKSKSLSQSGLGDLLSLSAQQIGKYERGENRMPVGTYDRAMGILRDEPGYAGFGEDAAPYTANLAADVENIRRVFERIRRDVEEGLDAIKRLPL